MHTTILCPAKAVEGLRCLAHNNAEVERSLSENSKVLTGERSLLSDDSINEIRLTKNAIRVTVSGHAHKMPNTSSLMQAQQSAYVVYTKRMEDKQEERRICNGRLRQPRRIKIHRTY